MIKQSFSLLEKLIFIIFLAFSFFYFNSKEEKIMEEIAIIKSLVEDIDNDIYKIEETFTK